MLLFTHDVTKNEKDTILWRPYPYVVCQHSVKTLWIYRRSNMHSVRTTLMSNNKSDIIIFVTKMTPDIFHTNKNEWWPSSMTLQLNRARSWCSANSVLFVRGRETFKLFIINSLKCKFINILTVEINYIYVDVFINAWIPNK